MTYRLIKHIDDEDIPLINSVYRLPLISRFISINETNYWKYVTGTYNVWFYKIFENNCLVATIHLELSNRVLYMDIVVFPEYHNNRIATRVLNDIIEQKLFIDFDKIRVSIDEENVASLKLFENAGFICVGQDEELREYEYIV
ncbi:MAG: GNAT family N-acetyltransferase [Oscillospiraceae bacterium]|nr:GNAT family N-acetyltransferase [Oscillospiraceae bacterium]